MKITSLMLGTPYTRVGASSGYLDSLAKFSRFWERRNGYAGYFNEPGTSYGIQRNRLVTTALDLRVDWLLQVDDDIRFPPNLPDLLLEGMPDDASVIIGSVPIGPREPFNVFEDPDGLARMMALPPKNDDKRTVKGFGGAVMMVHTSVYLKMADAMLPGIWYAHEQVQTEVGGGVVFELEPDLSFARRLMKLDIPAWAKYGLDVSHNKPYEWRWKP